MIRDIWHPRLTLVTAPASEPVTTAEAKSHARVDISDDDTLLGTYITAARLMLEKRLSRSFVDTTWDYTVDYFASPIKLPMASVSSITSITYKDAADVSQTLSSSLYRLSSGAPGYVEPVYGNVFPVTGIYTGSATIRFVAGYGADATYVPETIKLAIKMMVAFWYSQREHINIGNIVNPIPDTVEALLDSERWY